MFSPVVHFLKRSSLMDETTNLQIVSSDEASLSFNTFSGNLVRIDYGNEEYDFPPLSGSVVVTNHRPYALMSNYICKFNTALGMRDIKAVYLGSNLSSNPSIPWMSVNIDNNFLKQFTNIEEFGWDSYSYGYARRTKTICTGDWGDIPTSIKKIIFRGDNINFAPIFDTANMASLVNLEYFDYYTHSEVVGMGVILRGDVALLPRNMTFYRENHMGTKGILTGKLSDFPNMPYLLGFNNSTTSFKPNNIVGYDAKIFPPIMQCFVVPGVTLTSSELDQFLIDISKVTTWTGFKRINLKGTNIEVRTIASNSAVAILQSKGVSITVSNNTF